MKLFRSRILAAVAALLLMVAPLVGFAGEVNEGQTPGNGKPYSGDLGAGWDGSSHRVLRSDASGILRMTEEYPAQLQNERFLACDTTLTRVINGVLRPVGLAWSVSPFGSRSVLVTRVQKGTPNTLKLYLFGSDDNVNFYPLISQAAWTTASAPAGHGDSTKVDTIGVTIPTLFAGPNTVRQFKIALPEAEYAGRYLQIWATRTDSAYASNSMPIGLEYEGRWK